MARKVIYLLIVMYFAMDHLVKPSSSKITQSSNHTASEYPLPNFVPSENLLEHTLKPDANSHVQHPQCRQDTMDIEAGKMHSASENMGHQQVCYWMSASRLKSWIFSNGISLFESGNLQSSATRRAEHGSEWTFLVMRDISS